MELKKLTKTHNGEFLNSYIAEYKIGNEKNGYDTKLYELVSRDSNLDLTKLKNTADAVSIIATDESGEKILLQKEFRLALNRTVYNFPGGLIDPGETAAITAKRELKEETGLDLYEINKILAPSAICVGITNEMIETVYGKAKGSFTASTSPVEEIEAAWYTKEEVRKLIDSGKLMSTRTQCYLDVWSNS